MSDPIWPFGVTVPSSRKFDRRRSVKIGPGERGNLSFNERGRIEEGNDWMGELKDGCSVKVGASVSGSENWLFAGDVDANGAADDDANGDGDSEDNEPADCSAAGEVDDEISPILSMLAL